MWIWSFYRVVAVAALATSLQWPLQDPEAAARSAAPEWRDDLLSLHKSLVEIESISGNEYGVGNFLVEYLTERGYVAQLEFVPPQESTSKGRSRFNILAWRSQTRDPTPRVLVSSHIDVVPPFIPYSISDKKPTTATIISGRGSVDAKGSVAAQIIALQNVLASEKVDSDDVMLLFVVGEENSGDGMKFFSDTMSQLHPPPSFEAVIFGEPTENKLACGHKGGLFCRIKAKGVAGHSGYPWLGKSANELIVKGLAALLTADLGSSDKYGNTTINIGHLEGGVAANVIPEFCQADMAIRVAIGPEDDGGNIVSNRILNVLAEIDSEALALECSHGYGVVETACDIDG
jgi:acetylornithine deacetylase